MKLETVLDILDLTEFYPEKISRDILYQITEWDLNNAETEPEKIAWQFINKIVQYNYNARTVRNDRVRERLSAGLREKAKHQKKKLRANVHPLDIVAAVFLCCDPIARQDIVTHLWECRLAIPFVLPPSSNFENKLSAYIWPLRGLVGLFRQEDGEFIEEHLVDQPFHGIGVIKVGEICELSKSHLLNCLIWGSEKTHPSFFHKNCKGSKKIKSDIINGLVEMFWYLPSGEVISTENFRHPTLFVNLRGDAINHNEQVELIGKLSLLTIILTDLEHFDKCVHIVKILSDVNSFSLILLTNEESDLECVIEELLAKFKSDTVDILAIKGKMLPEILENIHQEITFKTSSNMGKRRIVLSNSNHLFTDYKYTVDEENEVFQDAFEIVNKITEETEKIDASDRKSTLFPLQERFWKEWSERDRDYWRYHQMDVNERKQYGDRRLIKEKLIEIRIEQYEYLKNNELAVPMQIFFRALLTLCPFKHLDIKCESKQIVLQIFLRYLRFGFDKISKTKVESLNSKYRDTFAKFASTSNTEHKKSLKMTLVKIEKEKSNLFFSVENVFREMGQIYEACESTGLCGDHIPFKDADVLQISHKLLPRYACAILQEGCSLEILDGDACSVPLSWLKQIFSEFPNILSPNKVPKVRVISVLGIQSSGKSTFLNTAFGLRFPVCAGRCTRGAFMQVVKVHPSAHIALKNDLDYIFLVDTEGLKSVLLSPTESVQHDNELSTFAIGQAQTTVINLMSENSTYLRENLPIVVHAFLRMFMVKLHRRCVIVHHNMDKTNKHKLLEQEICLRNILDELTARACELEKLPRLQFEEIIQFDIQNHTRFIPSLLEGKLPMAPISNSYSREVKSTKNIILNMIPADSQKGCIISNFEYFDNLEKLWTAIKEDRFVFEYRTTSEICLKLEVDSDYTEVLQDVVDSILSETNLLLRGLQSDESLDAEKVIDKFRNFIEEGKDRHMKKLSEKFAKRQQSCTFLEDLNKSYIRNLNNELDSCVLSFKKQVYACIKLKNIRTELLGNEKLEQFQIILKENGYNFQDSWTIWWKQYGLDVSDFMDDALSALRSVCNFHKNMIKKENVQCSPLLKDFVVDSLSHINHVFRNFKQTEVNELAKKMYEIKKLIEDKFDSDIHHLMEEQSAYSEGITTQILINIDALLKEQLKKHDTDNCISNQYKIDLLTSVAKTCAREVTLFYTKSREVQGLKKDLYNLMLSRSKRETEATHVIFTMLDKSIVSYVRANLERIVFDAIKKSCTRKYVMSKSFLIAHFLIENILTANDDMLAHYIKEPVFAIRKFLFNLFKRYLSETFIENDLQFYIRLRLSQVLKAFDCEWEKVRNFIKNKVEDKQRQSETRDKKAGDYESVSLGRLVEIIAEKTDLSKEVKLFAEKSLLPDKAMKNKTIDMGMLQKHITENIEDFIRDQVKTLRPLIRDELDYVSDTCSKTNFERLIGCEECCKKCKEICILSNNHDGDHIFILHRPLERVEDIDHVDISCAWKWIAYKHFEKCQFALNLSDRKEEWSGITETEVINHIKKMFKCSEDDLYILDVM